MINVKRKDGESSEGLLRRFTRRVQSSKLLIRVKKGQHRFKDKSRNLRREDAVTRTKMRTKIDYLRKIGKLEDKPFGRSNRSK